MSNFQLCIVKQIFAQRYRSALRRLEALCFAHSAVSCQQAAQILAAFLAVVGREAFREGSWCWICTLFATLFGCSCCCIFLYCYEEGYIRLRETWQLFRYFFWSISVCSPQLNVAGVNAYLMRRYDFETICKVCIGISYPMDINASFIFGD